MINYYHKIFFFLGIFLPIQFASCQVSDNESSLDYSFPYNLEKPDAKFVLPIILEEISGLAWLTDDIMVCIQDEDGKIFFYHMDERRIIKSVDFGKDADYEDIAIYGDVAWVLRSDGKIFELKNFDDEKEIDEKSYKTQFTKKNNCEGLCYDPLENELLIACKGDPDLEDQEDFKGFKAIYKFDLKKEKLSKNPAYLIELKKIKDFEKMSYFERISHRIAGSLEESGDIRFQPSAVGIHPITHHIYVLASVGKVLIVLNRDGEIISKVMLDKWMYVQPEGITFSPDGTLFISNEGDGGNGTIMQFEMIQ